MGKTQNNGTVWNYCLLSYAGANFICAVDFVPLKARPNWFKFKGLHSFQFIPISATQVQLKYTPFSIDAAACAEPIGEMNMEQVAWIRVPTKKMIDNFEQRNQIKGGKPVEGFTEAQLREMGIDPNPKEKKK